MQQTIVNKEELTCGLLLEDVVVTQKSCTREAPRQGSLQLPSFLVLIFLWQGVESLIQLPFWAWAHIIL